MPISLGSGSFSTDDTGRVTSVTTSDGNQVSFNEAQKQAYDKAVAGGDPSGGGYSYSQSPFQGPDDFVNAAQNYGITMANPYGTNRPKSAVGGFFDKIANAMGGEVSYPDLSDNQRRSIMERSYARAINPYNEPNKPGYFSDAGGDVEKGIARAGLKAGEGTVFGTAQDYRQPMSGLDQLASLVGSAAVPLVGGALMDQATRVTGVGNRVPEGATPIDSPMLSGILGPGVEAGQRLLDKVMSKADVVASQPKAEEVTFKPRPKVNIERRPLTVQDPTSAVPSELQIDNTPLNRDPGIMDALMGGIQNGVNAPQVSGLATLPTQEVADSSFTLPTLGEVGGIVNDAIKGNYPKLEVPMGDGKLNFNVNPIGDNKKVGVQFNMPLSDMGLGGLFKLSQAQPPADGSFDVADTTMLGNFMKKGSLKNQGGGFFGSDNGGARYYQFGTQSSNTPSSSSSGSASFLDKMGQMFNFNPNRARNRFTG